MFISESGVGPLNDKTAYSEFEMRAMFPEYRIERYIEEVEWGWRSRISFKNKRGDEVIAVFADQPNESKISTIIVYSKEIQHQSGSKVGDLYSYVYGNNVNEYCMAGQEEYSSSVLCQATNSKNVTYVFSGIYSENIPDGIIPDIKHLSFFYLREIIWRRN